MGIFDWAEDAADAVGDAVSDVVGKTIEIGENIGEGDFGAAAGNFGDLWMSYTPAGVIIGEVSDLAENEVHVANATGAPIAVIVAPNKDWSAVDIVSAVALMVVTYGVSAAGSQGYQALKSAKTLWDVYKATALLRSVAGSGNEIYKAFAANGAQVIEHSDYKCVNTRSVSNPLSYMNPSQYAAVSGGSDLSVMLITEDGRQAFFNTNSDHSWIAYSPGYTRSEHGTIWNPSGELKPWDGAAYNVEAKAPLGSDLMASLGSDLYVVSNNKLWKRGSIGPNTGNDWSEAGEAHNVVAMASLGSDLYVVSDNKLWKRGSIGPNTGNDWSEAGYAYNVVAMASLGSDLYVVSDNKLWKRGSIGPNTGNDWSEAGGAYNVAGMTSLGSDLYVVSDNKLWKRGSIGPNTGNDWSEAGEAHNVVAMASLGSDLYVVSNNKLWKRGSIGPNTGNDWTEAGEAHNVVATV